MLTKSWKDKYKLAGKSQETWIFIPRKETITYGLRVKKMIEERWYPPKYYYHLKEGGHVAALKSHLNHSYFFHIDISKFFNSISKNRIIRCLKNYFSYSESIEIAEFSTVKDPSDPRKTILPYGFVQSVIISSLCLRYSKLGKVINTAYKNNIFKVSVYVDDIVISSNNLQSLTTLYDNIIEAAIYSKFLINFDKSSKPGEKTTCFNIELKKDHLLITEERMSKFIETLVKSNNHYQKEGILNYISSINIEQSLPYSSPPPVIALTSLNNSPNLP